ncbi:MAG TPA: class I adenylate-forming enzyme family protein [Dongiaceae bacterium]|nr:class I adenylate-forming enzyme family protein [Dongiaceae bacterium]
MMTSAFDRLITTLLESKMVTTPLAALIGHAQARPDAVAFIQDREGWTYSRLAAESARLARGMLARGIKKGDRVVLHMANVPELVLAYYACFRIGAIAVPLNTRLQSTELAALLRRLKPALYIGQLDFYGRVANFDAAVLPYEGRFVVGGPIRAVTDRMAQRWTALFGDATSDPIAVKPDPQAPAVLLSTAGATGEAKLVVHTQESLATAAATFRELGFDADQIGIAALPMVHASGLFIFLAAIHCGMPLVLFERFKADPVLDAIEHYHCSTLPLLPWMFAALLERQQAQPRKMSSLRTCLSGGDICPAHLQNLFPHYFGVPLRSFWQATEAAGSTLYGLQSGPVCRIRQEAEFRLVDDSGAPVVRGAVGELLLRGAHVASGYWAGPEDLVPVDNDGWFHTGDLMRQGEADELWFVGRKKDIIVRDGAKIAPVEVEHALIAHPAVQEAAVVGVPDMILGQRVVGFVKLMPDTDDIGLEAIRTSLLARVADYKTPEALLIIDEIPRNAHGKVDRQRLIAMAAGYDEVELVAASR